jgi:four helix bundle protein
MMNGYAATRAANLRARTKGFALEIVRFYSSLPRTAEAQVLGRQMLRSGTSVGAQYREACRGRSDAEFISKVEGALQELDETAYWLELLVETQTAASDRIAVLLDEANQLTAILVASVRTVKRRNNRA